MTLTETAAPRRRGSYRKRRQERPAWEPGDVLLVGRARWIIRSITGGKTTPNKDRRVTLHSASTVNHMIEWHTTLDKLPAKIVRDTQ